MVSFVGRCSRRSRSSAPRTVSSVAGPPVSAAAVSRISSVTAVEVAPRRVEDLRRRSARCRACATAGPPTAGGPAAGSRPAPGRRPARAASRRTRRARRARPSLAPARPSPRRPGACGEQAGHLAADQRGRRRRTGRPPSPTWIRGQSPQHRAGGGQRVGYGAPAGRRATPAARRPARTAARSGRAAARRGCAPAGSTRARAPRSARTASRSTRASSTVQSTASAGGERVGVHLGQRVGGVAQDRDVRRRRRRRTSRAAGRRTGGHRRSARGRGSRRASRRRCARRC